MPRRDAPFPRTRWGKSAPGSISWFALLVCLVDLGAVTADEFPARLPPVADREATPPAAWGPSAGVADFGPAAGYLRDSTPVEWFPGDKLWAPAEDAWTLQVMPLGLMYGSYLAGAKEPRFASYWSTDKDLGEIWDTALGGRLGLLRYGTRGAVRPEGWQVDLEGGVQTRLDPNADSSPLLSADFRVGVPVTWAQDRWQFKTGYYHISAHLGDEYLLMNPGARRINYVRDALLLGVGYFWTERLRLYGETAYAVSTDDGAEPWEFQFGAEWTPAHNTGLRGAPFAAVNGHLREEVDFGGNFVLQAGWAWRQSPRGSLFRVGLEYFNGMSDQYEYFDHSEQRFGWGFWADF